MPKNYKKPTPLRQRGKGKPKLTSEGRVQLTPQEKADRRSTGGDWRRQWGIPISTRREQVYPSAPSEYEYPEAPVEMGPMPEGYAPEGYAIDEKTGETYLVPENYADFGYDRYTGRYKGVSTPDLRRSQGRDISVDALEYAKEKEAFVPTYYEDVIGYPTIGYGTTVFTGEGNESPVPGDYVDEPTAERKLAQDKAYKRDIIAEKAKKYGYDFNQNQLDALADFGYNVRTRNGRDAFDRLTKDGTRTPEQIRASILKYNRAAGKVNKGLDQRRKDEVKLWDTPVESPLNRVKMPKRKSPLKADPVSEKTWKKAKKATRKGKPSYPYFDAHTIFPSSEKREEYTPSLSYTLPRDLEKEDIALGSTYEDYVRGEYAGIYPSAPGTTPRGVQNADERVLKTNYQRGGKNYSFPDDVADPKAYEDKYRFMKASALKPRVPFAYTRNPNSQVPTSQSEPYHLKSWARHQYPGVYSDLPDRLWKEDFINQKEDEYQRGVDEWAEGPGAAWSSKYHYDKFIKDQRKDADRRRKQRTGKYRFQSEQDNSPIERSPLKALPIKDEKSLKAAKAAYAKKHGKFRADQVFGTGEILNYRGKRRENPYDSKDFGISDKAHEAAANELGYSLIQQQTPTHVPGISTGGGGYYTGDTTYPEASAAELARQDIKRRKAQSRRSRYADSDTVQSNRPHVQDVIAASTGDMRRIDRWTRDGDTYNLRKQPSWYEDQGDIGKTFQTGGRIPAWSAKPEAGYITSDGRTTEDVVLQNRKRFEDWYSHPETRRRLKEHQGLTDEQIDARIGAGLGSTVHWTGDQDGSHAYVEPDYVTRYSNTGDWRGHTYLKDPSVAQRGYLASPNVHPSWRGAFQDPSGYTDETQQTVNRRKRYDFEGGINAIPHEATHAAGFDVEVGEFARDLLGPQIKSSKYLDKPTEAYGNLTDLRTKFKLKPGQKVTADDLRKLEQKYKSKEAILETYKLENIAKALNTVADNEQYQSSMYEDSALSRKKQPEKGKSKDAEGSFNSILKRKKKK